MENGGTDKLTPTALSKAVGISVPYASQLLKPDEKDRRTPSVGMAIRIYRATGRKLGPISDASYTEIAILERFQGAA